MNNFQTLFEQHQYAKNDNWPDIDIVIPTLNCATSLKTTLMSVKDQDYPGYLNIIIVDGGSDDDTIRIAKSFGCEIYIIKNGYMHGLKGAYNFGMKQGKLELIMKLDSDNVLIGNRMIYDLVVPLKERSISFAEPFTAVDPSSSPLAQFGAVMEIWKLLPVLKGMTKYGKYFISSNLSYGLVNCSIFRRSVYNLLGGFASDTLFLYEMKRKGINFGAIVPSSKYYHYFSNNTLDFFKKWYRRIPKISGAISENQYSSTNKKLYISSSTSDMEIFSKTFLLYLKTRNRIYLSGIFYFMAFFLALVLHPISFLKISFSLKKERSL